MQYLNKSITQPNKGLAGITITLSPAGPQFILLISLSTITSTLNKIVQYCKKKADKNKIFMKEYFY